MNSKVYLIVGITGEYSDKEVYQIAITENKKDANAVVKFLNSKVREFGGDRSDEFEVEDREVFEKYLKSIGIDVSYIDYWNNRFSFEEFELNKLPKIFEQTDNKLQSQKDSEEKNQKGESV